MQNTVVSLVTGRGIQVRSQKKSGEGLIHMRVISLSAEKVTIRVEYPDGMRVVRLPIQAVE